MADEVKKEEGFQLKPPPAPGDFTEEERAQIERNEKYECEHIALERERLAFDREALKLDFERHELDKRKFEQANVTNENIAKLTQLGEAVQAKGAIGFVSASVPEPLTPEEMEERKKQHVDAARLDLT